MMTKGKSVPEDNQSDVKLNDREVMTN